MSLYKKNASPALLYSEVRKHMAADGNQIAKFVNTLAMSVIHLQRLLLHDTGI